MKRFQIMIEMLSGTFGTSLVLIVVGIIFSVSSFLALFSQNLSSLLAGFGATLFIAGFIGIINAHILSKEVSRITNQPFEDMALLSQIRGSGLEGIYRKRGNVLDRIIDSVHAESREVVIVGSSLKGLIGVGYKVVGRDNRTREILIDALKRGVKINILVTSPRIAHHRSQQEGRLEGDIEAEILENLMFFVKLRSDLNQAGKNLSVKLYYGTPTIFMVCTSELMALNPYPYYSTAYGSFTFLLRGDSELYSGYYTSHYQNAWTDTRLSTEIETDVATAKNQIKDYIFGKTEHGNPIIKDNTKRDNLLQKLALI